MLDSATIHGRSGIARCDGGIGMDTREQDDSPNPGGKSTLANSPSEGNGRPKRSLSRRHVALTLAVMAIGLAIAIVLSNWQHEAGLRKMLSSCPFRLSDGYAVSASTSFRYETTDREATHIVRFECVDDEGTWEITGVSGKALICGSPGADTVPGWEPTTELDNYLFSDIDPTPIWHDQPFAVFWNRERLAVFASAEAYSESLRIDRSTDVTEP